MINLVEIRCQNILKDGEICSALLCKTSGDTEVICRRCGCRNIYNSHTGKTTAYPAKKRKIRETSSGLRFE